MAAVFKKNKAKIEAYFAKQDLGTIITELRSEHLISKTEERKINSTKSSKRAHTLTKILESKIVNNPDLFPNLREFLGSFIDFSESPQPSVWPDIESSDHYSNRDDVESGIGSTNSGPGYRSWLKSTTISQTRLPYSYSHSSDSVRPSPSRPASFQHPATPIITPYPASHKGVLLEEEISTSNLPYRHNIIQSSEVFPGIDFSSYRSHAMVGHKGTTIRGEGVQLRIPPNAIEGGTLLDISLQGCISGPFSLPEGIQLASPVFLVTCTPPYQFQRELTLTIHHFVLLQNHEQCKDMVLLTSPEIKVEDKDYIYWEFHFCDQLLKCFPHASYGEVELSHFSFLCFGIRLRRGKSRGLSVYLQ
jgi:hypothetical protein